MKSINPEKNEANIKKATVDKKPAPKSKAAPKNKVVPKKKGGKST